MKYMSNRWGLGMALAGLMASVAVAANEWTPTTGVNDWFDDGNWSQSHYPQAGEDVVIANAGAGVLLTNSTAALGSLTLSNAATLVFTNWSTALNATTVMIGPGGLVTCAGPFMNNAMSNRVYIACTDLNLAHGGKIDVDSKGYSGGNADSPNGNGPGCSSAVDWWWGTSHGGYGGASLNLVLPKEPVYAYGSASAPTCPGSGGVYNQWHSPTVEGGHGGGVVRIDASGTVTLNGTITAIGGDCRPVFAGCYGVGGSGGSVYITCNIITGATGVVQADGGRGVMWGGNGGGGRIAVVYDAAAQHSVSPRPTLQYLVRTRYDANDSALQGDIGTVYFPDDSLLNEPINVFGQLSFRDLSSVAFDRLTVSNTWVRFVQDGIHVTVSNDLRIVKQSGIARLDIGGSVVRNYGPVDATSARHPHYKRASAGSPPMLSVGGNLLLTNGASLYVFSGPTNAAAPDYGALVEVAGDVSIGAGSWIYPASHYTNGGSAHFTMRNLYVAANAGFNANYLGWAAGFYNSKGDGLGGGFSGFPGGGGSYGGLGGQVIDPGKTYGSSNAPAFPGSGGCTYSNPGGAGGGLIWVQAAERIVLDGTLTANGDYAPPGWSGGGAGGGIHLQCRRFTGSASAVIRANGGNGASSGGGGGGRIAVWRVFDDAPGVVTPSVSGGTIGSPAAQGGTVVWGWLPPPGTVIAIR